MKSREITQDAKPIELGSPSLQLLTVTKPVHPIRHRDLKPCRLSGLTCFPDGDPGDCEDLP